MSKNEEVVPAAFGNLLYSLRSPSPAVLALRVTIKSTKKEAPPLAKILDASALPPQGYPAALRGLDPTNRMLIFGYQTGLLEKCASRSSLTESHSFQMEAVCHNM
jgi:hypothetical protein